MLENLSKAILVGVFYGLFFYLVRDFNTHFIWKVVIGIILYLVIDYIIKKIFTKKEKE